MTLFFLEVGFIKGKIFFNLNNFLQFKFLIHLIIIIIKFNYLYEIEITRYLVRLILLTKMIFMTSMIIIITEIMRFGYLLE